MLGYIMKEALSFRRHRIARAVRPQNRAASAKVRAVTHGPPLRQGAAPALTLSQPVSAPLSAHATPAIPVSATASAPTLCLLRGAAPIKRP